MRGLQGQVSLKPLPTTEQESDREELPRKPEYISYVHKLAQASGFGEVPSGTKRPWVG